MFACIFACLCVILSELCPAVTHMLILTLGAHSHCSNMVSSMQQWSRPLPSTHQHVVGFLWCSGVHIQKRLRVT